MGTTLGQVISSIFKVIGSILGPLFGGMSNKVLYDVIVAAILAVVGIWLWRQTPGPLKIVLGMIIGGCFVYFAGKGVFLATTKH